MEDVYDENPAAFAKWDARDSDDGAVVTGDSAVDAIEQRVAAGESVEDILAEWEAEGKAAGKASDVVVESGLEDEEIDDDYSRLSSAD